MPGPVTASTKFEPEFGWAKLPHPMSFKEATSVAVDSEDNVYVYSRGNWPVMVFDKDGNFLSDWGAGEFDRPHGIRIDADDNLYGVDSKSNLVRVYDSDGLAVRTITDGDLRFPSNLDIAYYDDGTGQMVGELYVGDQGHLPAVGQRLHHPGDALGLVVGVERERLGRDAVALEQLAHPPRVLGQEELALAQDAQRPQRHVLQVADGRRDDVEHAHG